MAPKTAPTASDRLQAEFNEQIPALAEAMQALIRGFLPRELRNEPFSITIEVTHGTKKRRGKLHAAALPAPAGETSLDPGQ